MCVPEGVVGTCISKEMTRTQRAIVFPPPLSAFPSLSSTRTIGCTKNKKEVVEDALLCGRRVREEAAQRKEHQCRVEHDEEVAAAQLRERHARRRTQRVGLGKGGEGGGTSGSARPARASLCPASPSSSCGRRRVRDALQQVVDGDQLRVVSARTGFVGGQAIRGISAAPPFHKPITTIAPTGRPIATDMQRNALFLEKHSIDAPGRNADRLHDTKEDIPGRGQGRCPRRWPAIAALRLRLRLRLWIKPVGWRARLPLRMLDDVHGSERSQVRPDSTGEAS